jgi:hypothetical protein
MALRLNEYGPAGSQTTQGVVQTTCDGDKFSWHRTVEVRTSELCCPLERAILIQDDSLVDQGCPGQEIRKTNVGMAILSKVHHD